MSIEYACEGAVGYITLNGHPGNNYDLAGMEELARIIDSAADDAVAKVIVIRSAVRGIFCIGADLRYLTEASLEDNTALLNCVRATFSKIATVPKPFIALIQGHALGGGLELALACDFRFAAEGNYQIGLPETSLGFMPGSGGTQRLARLIGPTKALELMFLAKRLTPVAAHALGILDHLFPAAEAADRTGEYAHDLAQRSSFAMGSIKLAVWQGIEMPLSEGLELEKKYAVPAIRSSDSKEGIRAFTEKRPPNFQL